MLLQRLQAKARLQGLKPPKNAKPLQRKHRTFMKQPQLPNGGGDRSAGARAALRFKPHPL
jgi:hypothetical protein